MTLLTRLFSRYQKLPTRTGYVWLFCTLLVGGIGLAFLLSIYHLLQAHAYYPYVTFLYDPQYIHLDFYELYENISLHGLHVYQGDGSNYPPLVFLLLYPLSFLPYSLALKILIWGFLAAAYAIVYKLLPPVKYKWLATGICVFCCFPVLFAINRANIEMLVFLTMAPFLENYQKHHFYKAAFWLAIAINLKIYPAVFLLLFISEKQWKPLLSAIAFTGGIFITSFYATGGIWADFLHGFQNFSALHQFTAAGLQFSNALFNLIRFPAFFLMHIPQLPDWNVFTEFSQRVAPYYFVAMLVLCGGLFLRLCTGKMPFWQKVFLLCLGQTTFPFVSYNYTLISVLLPVCFFLQNPPKKPAVIWLSALALVPMPWILFHLSTISNGHIVINVGSFVRPGLLVVLLFVLLCPIKTTRNA